MANYPHDDEDIPLDPSTMIRRGPISAVTLDPPRCKVRYGDPDYDDGDIETPWIKWIMLRAGKTRKGSAPSLGEEAVVLCPDGQVGNGLALCGIPNDNFPLALQTLEEDVTEYDDGARIGYDPESHSLTATLPAGASVILIAPGGTKLTTEGTMEGSLHATGALSSGVGASGTFSTSTGRIVTVAKGLITNID